MEASHELNQMDLTFIKNWVLGHYDPVDYPNMFIQANPQYTVVDPNKIYFFHIEALQAFYQMSDAAKNDGISLLMYSSLRNFTYQARIWQGKYQEGLSEFNSDIDIAYNIMNYSAMPTTSRHHWGTDLDINSVDSDYFLNGTGLQEYEWLKANAWKFGFCQPYCEKDNVRRSQGYNLEQWHWSYMPISKPLLNYYNSLVTYADITGFNASQVAPQIKAIEYYVQSINQNCINFPINKQQESLNIRKKK